MNDIPAGSNDAKLTVAVDFDGVIADYDGWADEKTFGPPREDVVKALGALRDEGWKIIVFSCRETRGLISYLTQNSIPYDEVNQNSSHSTGGAKPVANVYWDDRAVCYSGNAGKDLEIIRNFRTWRGRR
jgi:hypothetical protein